VPMDVVKTRLQTNSKEYHGMIDAFRKIVAKEGVSALFLGFAPTVFGYAIQGAGKFGFYEYFKHQSVHFLGADTVAKYNMPIYLTASGMAEVVASVCLCPWESVRIKAVSSKEFASLGMLGGFSKIAKEQGMNGFYKGLVPILLKQVPYTMTQLTVFSKSVDFVYEWALPRALGKGIKKENLSTTAQLSVSVLCGVFAGVCSAITSHPADTVLSRINMVKKQSPEAAATAAKSTTGQVVQIVKELGFRGVWLGIGARCFMVGVLSAGMFLIYDSVKVMCGLPTSSGLEHKEEHDEQKETTRISTRK